jgi:hypothetical protein
MEFILFSVFSALCVWSMLAGWQEYKEGTSGLTGVMWSVLTVACMYMAISCWQRL